MDAVDCVDSFCIFVCIIPEYAKKCLDPCVLYIKIIILHYYITQNGVGSIKIQGHIWKTK